jgi:hypothetical protein
MSHSRLAASQAPRWIRCAGSIAYIEFLIKEGKIPEDKAGDAARLGTAVHAIIEHCIKQEIHPRALTKRQIDRIVKADPETKNIIITSKEISGASMCVERAELLRGEFDELFAERKYDLSFRYDVDLGGTCDISAFQQNGWLAIEDYKNGRGAVEASSYQLMIYALGAYHNEGDWYNFQNVRRTVIQPNASHPEGKIRSEEISVYDLLKWEEEVLAPAVTKIARNTAELIPGPIQCEWCPARHLCEANAKDSLSIAQIDFQNVASPKPELPAPQSLSKDQLAFVVDNKSRILKFLDACEKHVFKTIERGEQIGDYHLENKIGNRVLLEEKLKRKLKLKRISVEDVTMTPEPKLMTVTQLEAYLATVKKWPKDKIAKFMESVTERPVTGQKLAKTLNTAESDFSKLTTSKTSKK